MGRRRWMWTLAAIGLAGLLVWAWFDGGRRPLRWIEEPVTVPGAGG